MSNLDLGDNKIQQPVTASLVVSLFSSTIKILPFSPIFILDYIDLWPKAKIDHSTNYITKHRI